MTVAERIFRGLAKGKSHPLIADKDKPKESKRMSTKVVHEIVLAQRIV